MKVICAGFSKTGTKSLAEALRILGYHVYDFEEHVFHHLDKWIEIFKGAKCPDFATQYQNVDAVADLPPASFCEELFQSFPNCKVILTVRDNEEVWVESWNKHVKYGLSLLPPKFVWSLSPTARRYAEFETHLNLVSKGILDPDARFLLKKKYREHNERIKSIIPQDQLLVFNVKDGRTTLCQFLGRKAIPDCPFPRENVKSGLYRKMLRSHPLLKTIRREIFTAMLYIVIVLVVASFFSWYVCYCAV